LLKIEIEVDNEPVAEVLRAVSRHERDWRDQAQILRTAISWLEACNESVWTGSNFRAPHHIDFQIDAAPPPLSSCAHKF
jgi:hypothetical protein